MNKLLFGTVAIGALALSTTAFAADMPVKAPVYKAPVVAPVVYSWTGCYVGGDVGYAWGRDSDNETNRTTGAVSPFTPASSANVNGFKAGGYIGCNWQVSGPFVFGVEGDGEWAHLTGSTTYSNTGAPPDFYETRVNSQGSIRGRVGYAWDRVLLYVTGGIAFAHINEHDVVGTTGAFTDNAFTRTGWTVGAGFDYAFTNNLIGRVEYRYADFGTFNYTAAVFPAFVENHKYTESVVRVGLAYKFDWAVPAAVVTRY
jgi:outer membrane immunogenic protein